MTQSEQGDVVVSTRQVGGKRPPGEGVGRGSAYSWTVRLREGGRVVGMVSTSGVGTHRATFGYVFARDTWRQGMATEAANAVVEVLRQIGGLFRV